jgi:hypothetical protein
MSDDIIDKIIGALIDTYIKNNFTICYFCKKARRVDIESVVDCAEYGTITPALACQKFEMHGWLKTSVERAIKRAGKRLFGGADE